MTSRWMTFAAGLVLNAAFAGAALAAEVTAPIKDGNGDAIGEVQVTGAPHGVLLRVSAKKLTPGWHGIHFHEKGDCSPDAFTSAGAHVHTAMPVTHGLLNAAANDDGDLPNIYAAADGSAHAEIFSALVRMPQLMDADGSSVVIHASPDDHTSQPIGGAGARVACAVIK